MAPWESQKWVRHGYSPELAELAANTKLPRISRVSVSVSLVAGKPPFPISQHENAKLVPIFFFFFQLS